MPINITDEFRASTTKGKIASAKEVFLTGDTENLQQIGEKTHQLEDSIKNIAATGGASTAAAVTFDNAASGMTAVNAQGAIEELNTKNKVQDTELSKKVNAIDVTTQINEEKSRVDSELGKKVAKADIVQELGDNEDKVVSQKCITNTVSQIEKIQGGVYDVSAHNNDAVFGSLQVLLSSPDLSTLIPTSVRHGGMSIRFIQSSVLSSDNKYVQYRLMAQEFNTDINAWIDEDSLSLCTAESVESLNFRDVNGNVGLNVKSGHLKTKNFDSRIVATKYDILTLSDQEKVMFNNLLSKLDNKQDVGNYVEYEYGGDASKLYFKDESGNVIAEFVGGDLLTKHFNSRNALVSQGNSQNLSLVDSLGNVILSVKNGHIATSKFKSIAVNRLLSDLLERVINIEKDETLLSRKMVPAISWIDDDFATEAEKIGKLTIYKNWCNSNNIHGDIALIPDAVVDREKRDISRVYFTNARKALIETFENEGFEFLVHPPHDGLYNNDTWNTQWSDDYIRKNIAMTIRCFLENHIVPDILVYPGASGGVTEVIKCAKKFFSCAIQPSGGANGLPLDRYNIKRVNVDNISAKRTVTQIKQEIANAISNHYWVILCSHVWMCTGDGTEATDETSMSFANLFDIVTYANNLIPIKPVREVWRDRSILWDYYTNIN